MILYVVFTDSNPAEVRAFFATQAQAIAWRDANFPAGQVEEARVASYQRVSLTVVNL